MPPLRPERRLRAPLSASLGVSMLLVGSCTGAIDAGPARSGSCSPDAVGGHLLRRLTADQYRAMVARLFPGVEVSLPALPEGTVTGYGYLNDARLASPTPGAVDAYHDAAMAVAAAAVAAPAWAECDPSTEACVQSLVLRLGASAFRHPLDAELTGILTELVRTESAVDGPQATLELAIQVLLESPEFLYFPESATADVEAPPGMRALSGPELANRLSLFLWDQPAPDDLVAASLAPDFGEEEALAAEVERMLADPRAEAGFRRFASQWMPLRDGRWGASLARDEALSSDAQLREDLQASALRFLRYAFLEASSVDELFTSRVAYVNDRIAPLFGIDPPGSPDALVEVELPAAERAGILTHPAVLLLASPTAPYVSIHRGVMILHQVTCQTVGNPRFDLIGFDGAPFGGTTRERLAAQHLSGCGGECHQMIDGAGFPFESFDSLGAYRTHEGAYPIDSSGNVFGEPTANTLEYVAALARSPEVHDCVTQHLYRYALGTSSLTEEETCLIDRLGSEMGRSGGDLRGLARNIVLSQTFRFVSSSEVVP